MSSKKLNKVFTLSEDAVDKSVTSGSPQRVLKLWGINRNEIKTAEDVQNVIRHFTRMIASSVGGLAQKVRPKPEGAYPGAPGTEGINPALEDALFDLADAAKALAKVPAMDPAKAPKPEPKKQQDPRTGWADDPNPETRGKKYPHRGYRSG